MSNKNSIKVKANVLEKFLKEKGYEVKHTHCIEAISIVETGKNYNDLSYHDRKNNIFFC